MEQRPCNIIMCCKGHCNLDGAGDTPLESIAAYMSHECACSVENYKGRLMESILLEALFDYFNSADKPGFGWRGNCRLAGGSNTKHIFCVSTSYSHSFIKVHNKLTLNASSRVIKNTFFSFPLFISSIETLLSKGQSTI